MEADLRANYGINVMAIKQQDTINITPVADDLIKEGDILVIIGHKRDIKKLQD